MFSRAPSLLSQRSHAIASAAVLSNSRIAAVSTHQLLIAPSGHTVISPAVSQRHFSDSHDDFAPKRKVVEGENEALKLIQEHVDNNPIMLYMKGNPSMPMCGFSARVVQVLQNEGVNFSSVNVLDYPDIREGVKKFSQWPTIPQLYVNGEFIGGCDIVTHMHEAGESTEILAEAKEEK